MESVAELLKWVLENLNYWVVTIFMAIESSFIPFPSEAVVPPAAWKAMADDSMNIFLVIVFATVGADIGALVNYYLARWLGRPIVYKFANSRLGHMCLIDEEKVHHAEEYFRKHGAASTFFGRLIPAVRQLISIPAGLAGMKLGPFLLYTTLGAGIWNTVLAVLGYLIYRFTDLKTTNDVYVMATKYSHEIGYVIIAVVILCSAAAVLVDLNQRRAVHRDCTPVGAGLHMVLVCRFGQKCRQAAVSCCKGDVVCIQLTGDERTVSGGQFDGFRAQTVADGHICLMVAGNVNLQITCVVRQGDRDRFIVRPE